MLCPAHATNDPCETIASVTGRRRRGTIRPTWLHHLRLAPLIHGSTETLRPSRACPQPGTDGMTNGSPPGGAVLLIHAGQGTTSLAPEAAG